MCCYQDAMLCLDRISHTALDIGLKGQNLSHTAIKTLTTTIETMVHKVRTVFDDSRSTYDANKS